MLINILLEVIIKITIFSGDVVIAVSIILTISCIFLDDFELSDIVNQSGVVGALQGEAQV